MSISNNPEEKRIDQEAADWVAKKVGGFTAAQQDAFFDWLAKDPRHSNAFAEHEKLWSQMDRLVEWMPEHSDKPNDDLLKYRKKGVWYYWIGGIAACLILGFGLLQLIDRGSQNVTQIIDQSFVANTYESHELVDGSVVELNEGAALKVNYTDDERRVELVSREAHFKVSHDPERPFIVSAAGVEIRAVGTAFNVKLDVDLLEVIVTEGRVQILDTQDELSDDRTRHRLDVGQRSLVSLKEAGREIEVFETTIQEMNQRLEWKPELLAFESEPLSAVVEKFNELNAVQIVIADNKLAEMEIVATFRSTNVMHLIALLELTVEVGVEYKDDKMVIIRGVN